MDTRREFLATLAAALAASMRASPFGGIPSAFGSTYASAPGSGPGKGRLLLSLSSRGGQSTLRFFDWDSNQYRDRTIPLENPHAASLDRKDPHIAHVIESWGSAIRVNLETGELVRMDHHGSDFLFSGHGVQSSSGELLFFTEIDRKLGIITTARSAKDLKRVSVLPKECGVAHQVIHMPNSSTLAIGTMGEDAGITFYDYEKSEVVRQVRFGLPILHLTAISSTEVMGVSHPCKKPKSNDDPYTQSSAHNVSNFYKDGVEFLPGPIVYAKTDGKSKKYFCDPEPDLMRFAFGVAVLPKPGLFMTTQQISGQVLLWQDGKVVRRVPVATPSHVIVSKDGTQFMVRSGESVMKIFSFETFQEIGSIGNEKERVLMAAAY